MFIPKHHKHFSIDYQSKTTIFGKNRKCLLSSDDVASYLSMMFGGFV